MYIRFILLVSMLALSSCTLSDLQPSSDDGTPPIWVITGSINTGIIDHQDTLTEDLSWSGDAYYPIFQGLETKTIRIQHHSRIPTKISFINSQAKSIVVSIVFLNGSGANLRLSQIILPNGTMDGPFGQKTGYNLMQLGGYELIFNENMMAGEPWSGEANIILTLQDTVYEQNAVLLQ